jgi:hypothetical protein
MPHISVPTNVCHKINISLPLLQIQFSAITISGMEHEILAFIAFLFDLIFIHLHLSVCWTDG